MSNRPQHFDDYAAGYDNDFTYSNTGKLQRAQVWQGLTALNLPPQTILEINCGTGYDAVLLAKAGHTVTATDISGEMIRVAKTKAADHNVSIRFEQAAFSQLSSTFSGQQFDMLFSDFGGLNCAAESELQQLSKTFGTLLKPGGRLFVVVMGTRCVWEQFYFLLKGDKQNAYRRLAKQGAPTTIGNVHFTTYYYSPARFAALMGTGFTVEKIRSVGLFVPPSYLEPFFKKHRLLLKTLNWLDKIVAGFAFTANYADHYVLVLKKKSN